MPSLFRDDAGTRLLLGVLLLALLGPPFAPGPWAGAPGVEREHGKPERVAGDVIVKFRPTVADRDRGQVRDDLGAVRLRRFRSGAEHWRLPPGLTTEEALVRLRRHPRVLYAEPNYIQNALRSPDDPRYPDLWGLHNTGQTGGTIGSDIHVEQAWDLTTGRRTVLVGVIDTGIDYTHPDLAANIYTNPGEIPGNGVDDDHNGYVDDVHGWDFRNDDDDPMDDNGHGTHVAGTIGAVGNNALGVTGVNWEVQLVPMKFLAGSGSGTTADAVEAVDYATQAGLDILNNSWGGAGFSQALLESITEAFDAGVLFVAAAGNNAANNDFDLHYPSGYDAPNVVSVAAVDHNDALASFSNYGLQTVDLAAPGVSILSTVPGGGYGMLSGTSMASPHVAGVAALLRAIAPTMAVVALKARLLDSVDPIPGLAGKVASGGRLNAIRSFSGRETVAPDAVTDLSVSSPRSFALTLHWTATGDDGGTGTASQYDIRYSTAPIDEAGFAKATQVHGASTPRPAGSAESLEVSGLAFSTTYYFALVAFDEWGNAGPMSNLAIGTTLGPPDIVVTPASLSADLFSGGATARTLMIDNPGVGDLVFDISIRPHAAAMAGGQRRDVSEALTSVAVEPADNEFPSLIDIALLESGADVAAIRQALLSYADIAKVAVLDGSISAPTLDTLRRYDAVIVVAGAPWGDPVATGNALADYADGGGGVVLTLASFVGNWPVRGRFETQGYHPLLALTNPILSSSLGEFVASHPIMDGVETALGGLLVAANLAPGAEWVADWSFGYPFIATKGGNVAAVNIFLSFGTYYSGDIPLILHNAAFWSSRGSRWLSTNPVSGLLPPGGSLDVVAAIDASGLDGGDYGLDLVVSSNDPDAPEVVIPVDLRVIGAPDISLSGTTLDFGVAYLGFSRSATLTISNDGIDDLTASVDVDHADVSVDPSSLVVPAGGSRDLSVTFRPTQPGLLQGILTIRTNDPDEATVTVPLEGTALLPPDIAVTPGSIGADLLTGQTTTRTLTIQNPGDGDLHFDVTSRVAGTGGTSPRSLGPSLFRAQVAGSDPLLGASDSPPEGYAPLPTEASLAPGATVLVIQSFRPWNTTSNEAVLSANGIVYDTIAPAQMTSTDLAAYSVVIIPSDQPTYYYRALATRAAQIDAYVGSGGVLEFHAAGWGWQNGDASLVTLPGGMRIQRYISETNRVLAPAHPLMAGVPDPFTGFASHAYFTSIPANAVHIAQDDAGRTNLVEYRFGRGMVVAGCQTFEFGYPRGLHTGLILRNLIPYTHHGLPPNWLAVEPSSGVVPAGGSLDLLVTFDPGGHFGGDYDADLHVTSNDPDEPKVVVPTRLHVTGVPDIAVGVEMVSLESRQDYSDSEATTHHVLATAVPPDGGGVLELIAEGDFGAASETATAVAEGRTLGSADTAGSDCTEARSTFDIGAADFAALTADGVVQVDVRNSPDVGLFCAVNRHTVRLTYAGPAERLDFGDLFIGLTSTKSFVIRNEGTADLSIIGITTDDPAYVPDASAFVLGPGEQRTVGIALAPTREGPFPATLTVRSTDPDEGTLTMALSGTGRVPPDIAVTPERLETALFTGEATTRSLTIENTGPSDLHFDVEVRLKAQVAGTAGISPESSGSASSRAQATGSEPPANAPDSAPEGYVPLPTEASMTPRATVLIVQSVRPWDTSSNEAVLSASGILYDIIGPAQLASTNLSVYRVVIVPGDQPTSYYSGLAGRADQINAYVSAGGILEFHAAGWGWSGGNVSLVTLPGGMHILPSPALTNRVLAPGHPLMAGVPETFSGFPSSAYFSAIPANAVHIARDDTGRTNLVEYRFGRGTVVAGCQTFEYGYPRSLYSGLILHNMIPYTHSLAANWLSVDPQSGVVPAGGRLDLALTFDAARLFGGDYDADLLVRSNDPDEPEVVVPTRLHVTGTPDIAVTGEVVILESRQTWSIHAAVTHHVLTTTIPPDGGGELELIAEGSYGGPFETATAVAEGRTLGSVGGTGLDCSMARSTFGLPAADLAALVADGVVRVDVRNSDTVDPTCAVSRHTVRLTYSGSGDLLEFGNGFIDITSTKSFLVRNDGTDSLSIAGITTDDPAYVADAAAFVLAPGERRAVRVAFTPTREGAFPATLTIQSNDPDEGTLALPLSGSGIQPPDIAIAPNALAAEALAGGTATLALTIGNSGVTNLSYAAMGLLPWIAIVPDSGIVLPGTSAGVTVILSAASLNPGIHQGTVRVACNDPDTPTVDVPVTFSVVLDVDHDGVPDRDDNCQVMPNPSQEDGDADAVGDACDNCATIPNADQADGNQDGSGDACQPSLILDGIAQDGGDVLRVRAVAHDPQDDPLLGHLEIVREQDFVLPETLDCSAGYLPDGVPGEGIGFIFGAIGEAFLFDMDSVLGCGDAMTDFLIAAGPCDGPSGSFESTLSLEGLAIPAEICVMTFDEPRETRNLVLVAYSLDSAGLRLVSEPQLRIAFHGSLPRQAVLEGLESGATYRLTMTVTDGTTIPVAAGAAFLYQGESRLIVNNPPRAVPAAPVASECDRPGGALIVLNGSATEDPDSHAGTQDDLASFEWLRDPGLPGEQPLGTGSVLPLLLPIGTHSLGLKVTDTMGESDMSAFTLTVRDTVPPALQCPGLAPTECSGPEGAPVLVVATASDACDPAPAIRNDRTSNGAHASTTYPLGSTPVRFTAQDASGNVATCDAVVGVQDTTPPALVVAASPSLLWPPNHTLLPVRISWQAQDLCDPSPDVVLLDATSSEPDDAPGPGDGATLIDISGIDRLTPDGDVLLRAERNGEGIGRTYSLVYQSLDGSGNAGVATASVQVPHDLGGLVEPMTLLVEQMSVEGKAKISWPAVPGALTYDVIVGDLSSMRRLGDAISLGSVRVLARGTDRTHVQEDPRFPVPPPGNAFIYLAQPRNEYGGAGYGTESAPWPLIPDSCVGGCP